MRLTTIRQPEGKTFSAVFAGDVCPKYPDAQEFVISHSDKVAAGLKEFFAAADLRLMQWETALTEADTPIVKSGPNLKCPKECLALGKAFGIDVMLLANNHVGDFGPDAVNETVAAVKSAGFQCVGAGKDLDDARQTLYTDCKGFKAAIINFAENEFGTAGKNKPGVAPLDPFKNIRQIKEARQNADIVMVTIHGGHEQYAYPSPRMKELYCQFAEAGADVVWNCHTHIAAGMEVYNGIPVIYSPGNFYFPYTANMANSWFIGYVCKFHFDSNGVYAYEIQPYRFNMEEVAPLKGEKEEAFFEHFDRISAVIQDKVLLQKYFEAWCTGSGVSYLSTIATTNEENYPPDWNNPEVIAHWIRARNLFTCESHSDLLKQTMRLVEEKRMDEAKKLHPEVTAPAEAPWY